MKNLNKRVLLAIFAGLLGAFVWFTSVRVATFKDPRTHYHANFALYINGKQDLFEDPSYYEETAICDSDEKNNPKARVHLHDGKNGAVHVHDKGATWGALFSNLRYGLTNTLLQTQSDLYKNEVDGNKLQFILNGEPVNLVANQTIDSEDTLLIAYGKETEAELKTKYEKIVKDAGEYNKKNDPSSCKGSKALTILDKLKDIYGFRRIE